MDRYLVDFEQGFSLDQSGREREGVTAFLAGKQQRAYKKKEITDIQVWTDIVGTVEKKQWLQAGNVHRDKLEEYRNTKTWEKVCKDDQDDYDADQIISDIKNLNAEKHFNTVGAGWDLEADLERLAKDDKQHSKAFNATLMQSKEVKVDTQDREALDKIFNRY